MGDRRGRRAGGLRVAALAVLASLALAACGSSGNDGATPMPQGPSGALGVVTVQDATGAVQGLCAMRGPGTDLEEAGGVFYDRSHEELHVIAAAAEVRDRQAAALLLEAKEKVETDLRATQAPKTFPRDLETLLSATLDALRAIGVSVPGCG